MKTKKPKYNEDYRAKKQNRYFMFHTKQGIYKQHKKMFHTKHGKPLASAKFPRAILFCG